MFAFLLKIVLALIAFGCGRMNCKRFSDKSSSIFGGNPAVDITTIKGEIIIRDREEFPYMAAIEYFDEHWCGATIIADNAVLTAAHCLEDKHTMYFKVRVGGTFIRDTGCLSDAVQWNQARRCLIHPLHRNRTTSSNDIGIVWTIDRFKLNPFVNIIQLATPEQNDFLGERCVVLGWGNTGGDTMSNILLKATVAVISNKRCSQYFYNEITPSMICALDSARAITICNGDSGGPMIKHFPHDPKSDILIGIASFGYNDLEDGRCDSTYPSVYTKVGFFKKWVEKSLNEDTAILNPNKYI